MPATLVLQSHREPLPFAWLQRCLDSVRAWSVDNGFEYRFMGDELFQQLPSDLWSKLRHRPVIASDLARLISLQQALQEGYDCVLWLDADMLVFRPDEFRLCPDSYCMGREVWIQADPRGAVRAFVKVHNAVLMFRRGNPFLDFYRDTAERLLRLNDGGMPAQFVGPKLLTAIHNIAQCPVMETAGMLSPMVMRDLLDGGGDALELFRHKSPVLPTAANLSSSLSETAGLDEAAMNQLIDRLLGDGLGPSSANPQR